MENRNYYRGSRYHRGLNEGRVTPPAWTAGRTFAVGPDRRTAAVRRKKKADFRRLILRAAGMLLAVSAVAAMLLGARNMVMRVSYPRRYERLVSENCQRFGVDESLVYAVIRTESGFDPKAHSSVGALGLMQIMPDTFRWLRTKLPAEGIYDNGEYSDEEMLLDPEINIRYGVYLLSVLRSEFGSDTLAAAAYHAGMGKVRQWVSSGTLAAESGYGDIPSGVTSHYVYKVEKARKVYSDLYYG